MTLGFTFNNFWRLIVYCSYKCILSLKHLSAIVIQWFVNKSGISKIYNLHIIILIKHYILRLQISVHNTLFHNKFNTINKLGKHNFYNLFINAACFFDKIIKRPFWSNFKNKIQILFIFKSGVELNDIRVL